MDKVMFSGISQIGEALRARQLSCVELVHQLLEHCDSYDEKLGVFLTRFDTQAIAAAQELDDELARGTYRGPLHGIPISLKDVILAEEAATTGNSHVQDVAWSSGRDALVTAKLREAGAVILGKVSCNEFAFGAPDDDGTWMMPRNPWDVDRWAGGTSSGSGAGVAGGFFPASIGTDTAGSVRMPAAYCGISGFKQTAGLVSRTGIIPLSWSLDEAGVLARSVSDLATVAQALIGFDSADPASIDGSSVDLVSKIDHDISDLRIGVDRENHLNRAVGDNALSPVFEDAVSVFEQQGCSVEEITIPHYQEMVDAVMLTIYCEGMAAQQHRAREQWSKFSSASQLGFASGLLLTGVDFASVARARSVIRSRILCLFEDYDIVLSPTMANVSPPVSSGYDMSAVVAALGTHVWNGVGNPAVTVPMGFGSDGLPLGLQIAGRPYDDATVLRAAHTFQAGTSWLQIPNLFASSASP